jgi:hypothetical protein|nr:hypothetical protein [Kofleriaceae bacterium]
MSINIWKLSTLVCGGLFVAAVGWSHIPAAQADQSEPPVAMDSCEDQGHMEAALEHLRVARHELHLAEHNKADHRVQALARTQEAINQVKKGCRFADDRRDNE